MVINIGCFRIEIRIVDRDNPFSMGLRARRKLAKRIDKDACKMVGTYSHKKVARVKAMRVYSLDTGICVTHNFGLRACKEWVEMAFEDDGRGGVL